MNNERQHERKNPTLVEAIESSHHQAKEREQQTQQQIAESRKRINEAMNHATRDQVEAVINLSAKIYAGYNRTGFKLTPEEWSLIWTVLRKQQVRYVNGADHVCEYKDGDFRCTVCGEMF